MITVPSAFWEIWISSGEPSPPPTPMTVIAALQEDLDGTYVGDGVTVVEDVVVVVGRKDLR